jgi:hypothetical protein
MRMFPALAAVAIALALPATGVAGDDESGDDESVTRVSCVGGTAELRLEEADDSEGDEDGDDEGDYERAGEIEIQLRVHVREPVPTWRLVLLHERRLVYQGVRRSTRDGYALRYDREVPDWDGRQTVTARLATPSGRACRLEATI